jgi:hypothetical protein
MFAVGFDARVAPRTAGDKLIRDEFMRRREADPSAADVLSKVVFRSPWRQGKMSLKACEKLAVLARLRLRKRRL